MQHEVERLLERCAMEDTGTWENTNFVGVLPLDLIVRSDVDYLYDSA